MGVYPFMFGTVKDFEPVAQAIIEVSQVTHNPNSRNGVNSSQTERAERAVRLG